MRRYIINKRLVDALNEHKESLRNLNKELEFESRNIIYKNKTIHHDHLQKIENLFNKKFNLKIIYLDYGKNLGSKAFTKPIKKIRQDEKLAEFIGIMLGDGNIWNNRIRIAFDKRNKYYMDYVANLFLDIFGIELKRKIYEKTNNGYLYCNNLYAVEELIKSGLKRGDKIKNNLGIPDWIKQNKIYIRNCIKGLIDTGGCIYTCKREKQKYIKFTNFNRQLLKDFKEITNNLGYSFAKANKNNFCLYRKDEVVKFIKEIKPLKAMQGDVG
ncbi:MAG: LAGLIDADG family homing endonuclease [Candidatus Pacearchaeota archaeon]